MNRKYLLLLASITVMYFAISLPVLTVSPLPWPDEAVYADIAIGWLDYGKLTTSLWKGMIPGIETVAAWNPPGYFLLTAAVFEVFGRSLISQRLISLFAGFICLLLLIDISRRLCQKFNYKYLYLLGGLLVLDYQFMVATRLARAEIVILMLGMFSWWVLLKLQSTYSDLGFIKSFLIGAIAGLAGLMHPLGLSMGAIGIILTLIETIRNKRVTLKITTYLAGLFLPMLVWLFSIRPLWEVMGLQVQLASSRKVLEESWVMLSYLLPIPRLAFVFSIIGLVLLFILKSAYSKTNVVGWIVSTLAFCFSILVLWGRMMWYTVYALPFIYLAFTYWLNISNKKIQYPIYLALSLLCAQAYMTWTNIYGNPIPKSSYPEFCKQILQIIPDNSTVFLSATPDPYYCFLESGRHNRLLEFPVLLMPKQTYEKVLNEVDYIVYQKSYDQLLFQDFLTKYIDKNLSESKIVSGVVSQHKAVVIKLKSQDSRIITQTLPKSI